MFESVRCVALVAVIAVLAALVAGCGGGSSGGPTPAAPSGPSAAPASGGSGAPAGGSGVQDLSQLGITGRPSDTSPRGLLVTAFTATTPESPLETIGVQQGDVILSCNGAQQQMGRRLAEAIKGLQERGEPVTSVVLREGKQVTLERKEKLPAT